MRRIGTLTSGIVLLGVGLVLSFDTVFHHHWFNRIEPFWPLALVAIGAEVLWAFYFNYRNKTAERVRVDYRSISLLTLAIVIGFVFTTSEKVVTKFQNEHSSSVATDILNSLRNRSVDLPEQTMPLDQAIRVHIQNWHGSITVTGAQTNQITVKGQLQVILPQSLVNDLAVQKLIQTIMPTIDHKEDLQISVPTAFADNNQITRVDLEITVPKSVSVYLDGRMGNEVVNTVDGDVTFSNDAGNVTADQIGGAVSVRQSEGQTVLSNIGGNVEINANSDSVTLSHITGNIVANSQLGDVTLHDIQGKSQVICKSGPIHADNLFGESTLTSGLGAIDVVHASEGVTATTEEGSISVDTSVSGDLKLHSDKGVVSIKIPKTSSLRFDGYSSRGVVKGPTVTASSTPGGAHVTETMNDGTYAVIVTTGDGAIMVATK
ncbi:MAG: hypothetical protein JWN30_1895 [Bacilli bacterium]|nr:hypothetical protein [Bacilli bacterium]